MPHEKFNYSIFWNEIAARMQTILSEQENITWLNRISYAGSEENKLVLAVPSLFIRDYVTTQYKQRFVRCWTSWWATSPSTLCAQDERGAGDIEAFSCEQDEKRPVHRRIPAGQPLAEPQKKPRDPNINPTYRFDSFVVGDNSIFAYNVSLAIAKNPGASYNPCLIYGGVGLGKTHLIQSIGNYIQENT